MFDLVLLCFVSLAVLALESWVALMFVCRMRYSYCTLTPWHCIGSGVPMTCSKTVSAKWFMALLSFSCNGNFLEVEAFMLFTERDVQYLNLLYHGWFRGGEYYCNRRKREYFCFCFASLLLLVVCVWGFGIVSVSMSVPGTTIWTLLIEYWTGLETVLWRREDHSGAEREEGTVG